MATTKADRNMQVTAGELTTRDDPPASAGLDAATELRALRARLERARRLEVMPSPAHWVDGHCQECFERGRDAVIRLLLEG